MEGANLKPGDVLEYYVQVKDNFDLNGHGTIGCPAAACASRSSAQEQLQAIIQNQLEQIQFASMSLRLNQLRQKTETETLREGVDRSRKFDEADKAQASRLANDQSSTASQTMNIAEKLQQLLKMMAENKSPQPGERLRRTCKSSFGRPPMDRCAMPRAI